MTLSPVDIARLSFELFLWLALVLMLFGMVTPPEDSDDIHAREQHHVVCATCALVAMALVVLIALMPFLPG